MLQIVSTFPAHSHTSTNLVHPSLHHLSSLGRRVSPSAWIWVLSLCTPRWPPQECSSVPRISPLSTSVGVKDPNVKKRSQIIVKIHLCKAISSTHTLASVSVIYIYIFLISFRFKCYCIVIVFNYILICGDLPEVTLPLKPSINMK